MAHIELVNYIKEELSDGVTKASLITTLKKEGWSEKDIEDAYKQAKSEKTVPIPPAKHASESEGLKSIGDIISIAIDVLKERFWTYIGILALGWGILLGVLLVIGLFVGLFVGFGVVFGSDAGAPLIILGIVVGIVVLLALIALSVWPQLALIKAVSEHKKGMDVFEAYGKTKHLIVPAFILSIIILFVVYGGLILFIVPGIWISVLLILSMYVLVTEEVTGYDAMKKSALLVKGNWWGVFGRFFLLWIVVFVTIMLMQGILVSVFGDTTGQILYQIINIVINIVLGPFFVIFWYVVLKDLKRIKEPVNVRQEGSGLYITFTVLGVGVLLTAIIGTVAFALFASEDVDYTKDLPTAEELPIRSDVELETQDQDVFMEADDEAMTEDRDTVQEDIPTFDLPDTPELPIENQ